ncbi:MAG: hypothetical protein ACP5SJ_03825 [Candidatus Micrarchaeia archaeon]
MARSAYLFASIALMLLLSVSYSASPSSITINSSFSAFIGKYLPSSIMSSSSFYSQAVGNNTYIVIKTGNSYIVANVTGGKYSILVNSSSIYPVLHLFLIRVYFPNETIFSNMSADMHSYVSQASPSINDCLVETGLVQYNCTLGNECFSCEAVPVCRKVLSATGGPSEPFGIGIMNFSSSYRAFNSSYNSFVSLLSGINSSNFGARLPLLQSALAEISSVSSSMPQNPIFPLPSNFNPAQFRNCTAGYPSSSQPWYCDSVGFCRTISFNSTLLSTIKGQLSSLASLPITNSSIKAESAASAQLASSFVEPVIKSELTAEFNAFINATYPKYNSTVKEASFIASKLSNSSLSYELSSLEAQFAQIRNASISQNISQANASISNSISKLNVLVSKLSSEYMPVYNASLYNTMLITFHELDYASVPYSLAKLAAQEQSINSELSSQINSSALSSLAAEVNSIKASAYSYAPAFSMPEFVKSIDGGAITALLAGSSASIPSKISTAPIYAGAISFAIGIVVLLFFYSLTYGRLKKKHKIRLTHRTKRTWKLLFVLLFALVLIYAYATYAYAAGANSFLPISYFVGAVKSHSVVLIALNASAPINLSTAACATSLQSTLSSMGKVARIISISNYTCTISNATETITGKACYNDLLASGTPIILLGANYTAYKGLYGNIMYVGNGLASGSSCYIGKMMGYALSK